MRILILGGGGMLGHKLWQCLRDRFDCHVTLRTRDGGRVPEGWFDADRVHLGIDARQSDPIPALLSRLAPDVAVNCIGIPKQLPDANRPEMMEDVNGRFPHRLASECDRLGIRLIHISTDCVFSGRKGNYSETDPPDPVDLYGRTKRDGEPLGSAALILRVSFIGRQLRGNHGLLEWFLGQEGGRVKGFRRAIFSGLTTTAMSRCLAGIIDSQPGLQGVYHLASEPISKFDLLVLLRDALEVPIEIEPDETTVVDRSLNSRRFRSDTGITVPAWGDMVRELAGDPSPYPRWRVGAGMEGRAS